MKKIYLFIIGIILCAGVKSQITQINHSSMYGGGINGFAKNATCVLVGTDGGIFKTTNDGYSWTNVTQNFDQYTTSCRKIISIGNVFYAMPDNSYQTSIYKSSDNGANWTALTFGNFSPNDLGKLSDSLYIMAGDMNGGHLYSSIDGVNWNMRAQLWDNNQQVNSDMLSFNSDKLFILKNDTLFYTTNGSKIDTISFSGLDKNTYKDSDRLYGDVLGNIYYRIEEGIFKYDFNSKTWKNITAGKVPAGSQFVEFSVTDHAIFINAMPSFSEIMKFYKSSDQGNTFTEITNTGLLIPMIGNIIEVSANGFIGNALDVSIVISSDGGNTWLSSNNQFIATSASDMVKSGNTVLYSRESKGITLSNDKGINWSSINKGLPGYGGIVYFVRELTVVKDTLFAFCISDPNTEQKKLYKSTNNGNTWTPCLLPASLDTANDAWFAGKCDSLLYIYYYTESSNEYTVIFSGDFGKTWTEPVQNKSKGYSFILGTKKCQFIFSAPNDWDNFTNIIRVTDFTLRTDINNGMFNNSLVIKRLRRSGNNGNKGQAMMDMDAGNDKAIFVLVDRTFSEVDKLYQFNLTTNGWSQINTNGLPSGYKANCIKFIGNNIWLLATNTGLYKSTDAGLNWTITGNMNNWQKGMVVNSIQIIGNNVFLGTTDNGVWTTELTFDFNVGFTASSTLLTTTPFTVKITNTTSNKSNFKFTWDFGDNSSATTTTESYVMHTFAFNGDYTIKLTAEEKSSGFTSSHTEVDYITCAGGTQDTCFTPVISQGTTGTICGNDSIKLSTQKRKGYSYQWTWNNNILSTTDTVIYAKLAGDYKVKAINGVCNRVSTPYTLMTYSVQKPIIYSTGIINTCSKDSMKLSVAPAFSKYSWSTGKTTAFIYIKKSQEYIVTVTDNNNCKIASDPYNANYSIINIPYICMVSVDSSNKNKIIWDKPVTKEIRSYNIYKESTTAGKYNLIGNVAYDKMSTFTDNNSVPSSHSDRYRITAIDTCGNETAMSTHHRTLHLSVSKNAMGSGYQLIWLDSYEGFNFYMYYIFRGTTKKNMVLIDSIQNTLYSYTDPTNLTGQLLYVVAAVKPGAPCNPTGSKGVFPVDFKGATYSVSNVDGFELHESIQDVEQGNMNIYPNPTNDKITIEMDNQNKTYNLEILNMIGQSILNKNVNNTIEQVDLSSCSTGIYFVKIKISDKTIVKKIIKN